jgi:hypothetical protein
MKSNQITILLRKKLEMLFIIISDVNLDLVSELI